MYIKVEQLIGWWIVSLLSIASFAASTNDLGLVEAVKNQNKDAARILLRQHADPNVAQGDGSTALHWAAHWGDPDTADLLIGAGANVNAANDLGVTPLYLACENGSAAVVEKLLAAGANPNAVTATGVSPLMMAARSGSVDAVQALLTRGAKINAKENSGGQTALMVAAAERHPQVVRVLVKQGADLEARSQSVSWLVNIRGGGNEDQPGCYVKVLRCGGATSGTAGSASDGPRKDRGMPKVIQVGESTALMFAARKGCIDCARFLLDGGANLNDAAPDGNTALVLAAHSGEGAFAAFLLEKGANPNADGAGYTAMHAAVLRGDLGLVKALLAHGANPNARLANGTPQRHNAPDFALPMSLVGATPFLLAANYASSDIMRVLAAGGADLKLEADDGTTPLMAAVEANERMGGNGGAYPVDESDALEAVKVMLNLGGDVNADNQAGNTALHIAAARGFSTVVQVLVDHGAKLDAKNKAGQTPLALTLAIVRRFDDLVGSRLALQKPLMPRFRSTADLLRKLGAHE